MYQDQFVQVYQEKTDQVLYQSKIDSFSVTQCYKFSRLLVLGSYFLDIFNLSSPNTSGKENNLQLLIMK